MLGVCSCPRAAATCPCSIGDWSPGVCVAPVWCLELAGLVLPVLWGQRHHGLKGLEQVGRGAWGCLSPPMGTAAQLLRVLPMSCLVLPVPFQHQDGGGMGPLTSGVRAAEEGEATWPRL